MATPRVASHPQPHPPRRQGDCPAPSGGDRKLRGGSGWGRCGGLRRGRMSGRWAPLCGAQGPAGGRQVTAFGVTGVRRPPRGDGVWCGGGALVGWAGWAGLGSWGPWLSPSARPQRGFAAWPGPARPFPAAAAVGGSDRLLSALAGRPVSAEAAAAPTGEEVPLARLPFWWYSAGGCSRAWADRAPCPSRGLHLRLARSCAGCSRSPTPEESYS